MANATALGPLDVGTIVQKLMLGQQGRLKKLQSTQEIDQVKVSSYGQLQSLVNTFQTQLNNVGTAFSTIGYQASSSNSSMVTASITSNEIAQGAYQINITQLATAQSYTSGNSFSSENTALGINETLTFTNNSSESFFINISSTDTLDNIRDNINSSLANIGITAAVVRGTAEDNVTPIYYLSLTAQQTGTINAFTISGDSGNDFNMNQQTQANDAMFTFDDINMVRSSNTVTDAMDGLELNLLATTAVDSPVTVSVSQNNQSLVQTVKTAIQSMLDAYNAVINYIDQNSVIYYTEENPFTHEKIMRQANNDTFPLVKTMMQNAMGQMIGGLGSITTLNDAGIVTSDMQTLTIPNTKKTYNTYGELEFYTDASGNEMIDQALANNFSSLQEFFTNMDTGFINNVSDSINVDVLGTGAIFNQTQWLNQQLNVIDGKIIDEESRLHKVQDTLLIKYSALNSLLAQLQATSDYLEKQFSSLDDLNHRK
jgi:flagellar hook-associated protein 2